MIIVGTSLAVSPANTLPIYAKQNGATLIEVNPEKTVMSNNMDLSIQATSANILPKILSIFKNGWFQVGMVPAWKIKQTMNKLHGKRRRNHLSYNMFVWFNVG